MKKIILLFLFLITTNLIYPLNLKIVWWNLQNFFDTTDDPLKKDTILTKDQYELKLSRISRMLIKINADIVGVCEIENINVLSELANKTNYPYYYLEEGNDPRGINIALLSKFPVNYTSNKDNIIPYSGNKNYKFSRDCPVAKLNIKEKEIVFILTHLKSKNIIRNDSFQKNNLEDNDLKEDKSKEEDNSKKRYNLKKENYLKKENDLKKDAEIFGILDIIDTLYSSYIDNGKKIPYLLIMGDFNANRYEKPLINLEKSGLKILNYIYSEDSMYTYIYNDKKEDIDYFVFNDRAFNNIKIKEFKALHSKEFINISDHFPLYLEIKF